MGVMEGSCAGYDACYAAARNSSVKGDVTGYGDMARTCAYAAACAGSFVDVFGLCLPFQTVGMMV